VKNKKNHHISCFFLFFDRCMCMITTYITLTRSHTRTHNKPKDTCIYAPTILWFFWYIYHMHLYIRYMCTGWRRPMGCLKSQIICCKWATNYRALLRKLTYKDKASYGSLPPCRWYSNEYDTWYMFYCVHVYEAAMSVRHELWCWARGAFVHLPPLDICMINVYMF